MYFGRERWRACIIMDPAWVGMDSVWGPIPRDDRIFGVGGGLLIAQHNVNRVHLEGKEGKEQFSFRRRKKESSSERTRRAHTYCAGIGR